MIDCRAAEEEAFWAWAIIEILGLTGIRLEELLDLSHLSIRHYAWPTGNSWCYYRSHRLKQTANA